MRSLVLVLHALQLHLFPKLRDCRSWYRCRITCRDVTCYSNYTLLKAILKFCTTNQLFKYFRKRYSDQQLKILNRLVKTRGKMRSLTFSIAFLKAAISQKVVPKWIHSRIEVSRARHTPTMERAFMHDEIAKKRSLISLQKSNYRRLWSNARRFLSYFDLLRFCRYLAKIDNVKERDNRSKNERNFRRLRLQRFGNEANPDKKNIINLSNYKLSATEEFVLSHGPNFCFPPYNQKREETFAEFEVLLAQLQHHHPQSTEKHVALKAKLSDLAHAYCGTPVELGDFLMHKECFKAIKSLRSNENILITKPDNGSGVVILTKTDYVAKMDSILQDETKFKLLGSAINNDNTSKIESRIQRRLLQLHKDKLLPPAVYDLIRPTGSQRPRMYGLPKTHKKDVPLRPILSMTASAQHKLAKYLSYLLEPVLTRYSTHCIRDSFTFSDIIKTSNLDPLSVFLYSFDITSLFTNVPLAETIQICADALYTSEHPLAPFPRNIFVELMEMATSSVEFSFNNTMYRQTDGVAMGSPLGPTLANIFVGYYESLLFQDVATPEMYFRYMDDTFVVFNNENQCDNFLNKLNSLHPSLRFTFEKESNLRLPFLDVLVEKLHPNFLPPFTANLPSLGNIFIGILSALLSAKST